MVTIEEDHEEEMPCKMQWWLNLLGCILANFGSKLKVWYGASFSSSAVVDCRGAFCGPQGPMSVGRCETSGATAILAEHCHKWLVALKLLAIQRWHALVKSMVGHESGCGIDVVLEDDEVVELDHSH